MEKTLYKPDAEGQILVPYGISQTTLNAVVTYGDFAEIIQVVIPAEEIKFEGTILFNEESLFAGVNSEFLIQPKIFICGKLVNLNVIQSPSVIVKVINDKGVANSRTFDNVKLSYEEDLKI